jgi:cytochrome c
MGRPRSSVGEAGAAAATRDRTVCSLVVAYLIVLVACVAREQSPEHVVPGGDPERGAAVLAQYGCGSCHVIPGVAGARGKTGPPLTDFADRSFIAGAVPNNANNLIRWIRDPQVIEPGTAMPTLGVQETQARDIAAYLYRLR